MGKTVLKVSEIDWGRYGTDDIDAAKDLVWAKKLGVKAKDIKAKMKGTDLVEIEVKDVDPPQIKEQVRK
jgi:hypothetical protein